MKQIQPTVTAIADTPTWIPKLAGSGTAILMTKTIIQTSEQSPDSTEPIVFLCRSSMMCCSISSAPISNEYRPALDTQTSPRNAYNGIGIADMIVLFS